MRGVEGNKRDGIYLHNFEGGPKKQQREDISQNNVLTTMSCLVEINLA